MTSCPCQQCQNSTENGTVVTDIVTRLRAMCVGHTHSVSMPCPIAQAVDKIIWLHNDRNGWKTRALELDAQWVKEHGHG